MKQMHMKHMNVRRRSWSVSEALACQTDPAGRLLSLPNGIRRQAAPPDPVRNLRAVRRDACRFLEAHPVPIVSEVFHTRHR